jgi:hypothetical protein
MKLDSDQRKVFRVSDRFYGEVDIEIRPVEMVFIQKFDIVDCGDGRILKPWKIFKRKKVFLLVKQQPNPVLGNLRDFNFRQCRHFVAESILVNRKIQRACGAGGSVKPGVSEANPRSRRPNDLRARVAGEVQNRER